MVICYRRIDIYVNEMQDNKFAPHYQRAFCFYYESQTRAGFECQEKILKVDKKVNAALEFSVELVLFNLLKSGNIF